MTKALNELIEDGFILINEQKVKLQFYLGGDYKVSVMCNYDLLTDPMELTFH